MIRKPISKPLVTQLLLISGIAVAMAPNAFSSSGYNMCSNPSASSCPASSGIGFLRRYLQREELAASITRQREEVYAAHPHLQTAAYRKPRMRPFRAVPGVALFASGIMPPSYLSDSSLGASGTTLTGGSAADSSGNVIIAGGFNGSITCGNTTLTTTNTSGYDVFVAKLNSSGACQWARQASGATTVPSGDSLNGALTAAVDSSGNIYIGGAFVKSLTFANGNNPVTLTEASTDNGINFEPFIAKYDSNGNLLWANGGNSGALGDSSDLAAGTNAVISIVADKDGNVFAGGTMYGNNLLGHAVSSANSNGYSDAFIARLNPVNGVPIWASILDSDTYNAVNQLATDAADGVFAVGEGTDITFPTSPSPTTLSDSSQDLFLTRYANDGGCIWAQLPADSGASLVATGIASSPLGEPYITGQIQPFASFGNGQVFFNYWEPFIAKYDNAGNFKWAQGILPADYRSAAERIAVDASGNSYITGGFRGPISMTGNQSDTGLNAKAGNELDVFLAAYDAAGGPMWMRAYSSPAGSLSSPNDGNDEAMTVQVANNAGYNAAHSAITGGVIVTPANNIVLSGNFSGTLTADSFTLAGPAGAHPSFIASMPAASNSSTQTGSNPSLRVTIGAPAMPVAGTFTVPITLTNTGGTEAFSASIPTITLRALTGNTALPPIQSIPYGDVQPGQSVMKQSTFSGFTGKQPARFLLSLTTTTMNAGAAKLTGAASSVIVVP